MATHFRFTARAVSGLALGATFLGACADSPTATAEAPLARGAGGQGALEEGALYVANLHPLNARVQQQLDPDRDTPRGVAHGTAYFRVVNGMLHAALDVAGAEPADGAPLPHGLHAQHIHAAAQCPPASADVNGDLIVDVIEGVPFYGPILVPLDGDIGNATSEIPTFPVATNSTGAYRYEAAAPLATLESALGVALDLPARHVVVHGVDLATPLPATVQSLPGLPAQITLPVACGEVRQLR